MNELLGILFAIMVGTLLIPKVADYQRASNDNATAAITAQQQKVINAAATTYIQQNSASIQAIATPTAPAVITVAMLQAPGVDLLPASFSATNPYGQTWQVQVLEPTAGNLQALVMTSGGTALSDAKATKIASLVGAAGGLIPLNDSGSYAGGAATARGAAAGWSVATANYSGVTGGRPAALLTFNNGQLVSNSLYRNAVPGQPQLNTMNTPLIMASVQTIGGTCSTTGAIAQNGSGGILSCQSGIWKLAGGDGKCIGTSADLNAVQDDGRCYNGAGNANSPAGGEWFFLEVFRHINSTNFYVGQRVVGMTGAAAGKEWIRNQQSSSQAGGWSPWQQSADPRVSITSLGGEGGAIKMSGNDGVSMYIETLPGGTTRYVNSNFTAALQTVDQSGNIWNMGNSSVGQNLWTGGDVTVSRNINMASNQVISNNGTQIINSAGTTYLNPWSGGAVEIAQGGGRTRIGAGGVDTRSDINVATDYWGLLLRNSGGGDNAQPQNSAGSAYVNDVFVRAVGKWASQMSSALRYGGQYEVQWLNNPYGWGDPRGTCWSANPTTGNCTCPGGYTQQMVGMTYHNSSWDGAGMVCWAWP